jgi:hypothetical protein
VDIQADQEARHHVVGGDGGGNFDQPAWIEMAADPLEDRVVDMT